MAKLKSVDVGIKVPELFEITGRWEADEAQQLAAWEIYVEIVTRVAVVSLRPDEGLLREALSSLHALFDITRGVLRRGGPDLARPRKKGTLSLGMIAVDVLNRALRPMLSRWHPLLSDWEAQRLPGKSAAEHEAAWPQNAAMRRDLAAVQQVMASYAALLAEAAGVPALVPAAAQGDG